MTGGVRLPCIYMGDKMACTLIRLITPSVCNESEVVSKQPKKNGFLNWFDSLPNKYGQAIITFLEMGLILYLLGIVEKVVDVNIGPPYHYIGFGIFLMVLSVIFIIVGDHKAKARMTEVADSKEGLTLERLASIDKKLDELTKTSRQSSLAIFISLMVAGFTLFVTAENDKQKFLGTVFALLGLMPIVIPGCIIILAFPFRGIRKKRNK
jgi:hypothetical protein